MKTVEIHFPSDWDYDQRFAWIDRHTVRILSWAKTVLLQLL